MKDIEDIEDVGGDGDGGELRPEAAEEVEAAPELAFEELWAAEGGVDTDDQASEAPLGDEDYGLGGAADAPAEDDDDYGAGGAVEEDGMGDDLLDDLMAPDSGNVEAPAEEQDGLGDGLLDDLMGPPSGSAEEEVEEQAATGEVGGLSAADLLPPAFDLPSPSGRPARQAPVAASDLLPPGGPPAHAPVAASDLLPPSFGPGDAPAASPQRKRRLSRVPEERLGLPPPSGATSARGTAAASGPASNGAGALGDGLLDDLLGAASGPSAAFAAAAGAAAAEAFSGAARGRGRGGGRGAGKWPGHPGGAAAAAGHAGQALGGEPKTKKQQKSQDFMQEKYGTAAQANAERAEPRSSASTGGGKGGGKEGKGKKGGGQVNRKPRSEKGQTLFKKCFDPLPSTLKEPQLFGKGSASRSPGPPSFNLMGAFRGGSLPSVDSVLPMMA